MSWLLTDKEFEQARTAADRGEVTRPTYDFIVRLVSSYTRSGVVSPSLSPHGVWNEEAISDVVQEWFAGRLLRGTLRQAFDQTANPQLFARYLEQAFRNWLRDQARARSWPRILLRARSILDAADSGFAVVDVGGHWLDRRYTIATADAAEAASDEEVKRAIYVLPELEIVRYSGEDARPSPILSTTDLTTLLNVVATTLNKSFSLRQLDIAFRSRFAWAFDAPKAPLADDFEEAADSHQPGDMLFAQETAKEILAELSERQLTILCGRIQKRLTLDELAKNHDCSRGTVENELKRAATVIRSHLTGDENYDRLLEILVSLTFSERG